MFLPRPDPLGAGGSLVHFPPYAEEPGVCGYGLVPLHVCVCVCVCVCTHIHIARGVWLRLSLPAYQYIGLEHQDSDCGLMCVRKKERARARASERASESMCVCIYIYIYMPCMHELLKGLSPHAHHSPILHYHTGISPHAHAQHQVAPLPITSCRPANTAHLLLNTHLS